MNQIPRNIAEIEAELARQNEEWSSVQTSLLQLGDVELQLDPQLIAELEATSQPSYAGSIPAGSIRM